MEYVLAFLLFVAVATVVVFPLFRPARAETDAEAERAELEAAKEAKYREIRDARLDREMGKFSEEEWKSLDGELRAEAIEILKRLDRVQGVSDRYPA